MLKVGIKATDADPDYSASVWFNFENSEDAYDFIKQSVEHGVNAAIAILNVDASEEY